MTVYIYRAGEIVRKSLFVERRAGNRSSFPAPNVSRFEAYQSPVTEKTISSDRQREMDLFKSGSYDERDVGPTHPIAKAKAERKKANNAARSAGPEPSIWRD